MKKITLFLMLITAFVSAQNTKVARSIAGSSSIESTSNSFQIKRTLGQLAVAWTTYDFHLNGKFSHCGAESFTLTRLNNRWMVVDWAYTANEIENCNSPLGKVSKKEMVN